MDDTEEIPVETHDQLAGDVREVNGAAKRNQVEPYLNAAGIGPETELDTQSEDVEKVTADRYGYVEITGYGRNVARYIPVYPGTDIEQMRMRLRWDLSLEDPHLVLSVVGGQEDLKLDAKLRESITKGLEIIIRKTGAWVITDGVHRGASRLVGEIVRDMKKSSDENQICFGIAPWCRIQNNTVLTKRCNFFDLEKDIVADKYRIGLEPEEGRDFLDPNHSTYLLFDDNSKDWSSTHGFRLALEKCLKEKGTGLSAFDLFGNDAPNLVIQLVIGGDFLSLKFVHKSIVDNKLRAITVAGSGGTADLIALAHRFTFVDTEDIFRGTIKVRIDPAGQKKIRKMAKKMFGKDNVQEALKLVTEIMSCDLVSVYNYETAEEEKGLDFRLVVAIVADIPLKVLHSVPSDVIQAILDTVKLDVFAEADRMKNVWPGGMIDKTFELALLYDRHDIVELYVEQKFSIEEFLTEERLTDLYNKIPSESHVQLLLRKLEGNWVYTLPDVDKLINDLIPDTLQPLYVPEKEEGKKKEVQDELLKFRLGIDQVYKTGIKPDAYRDLFIWCILMLRQDMAKIFWSIGKNYLAMALLGCGLLKSMMGKAEDGEATAMMKKHLEEWSQVTMNMLNEMHDMYSEEKQRLTKYLLARKQPTVGNCSCLTLAANSNNEEFLSHTACQSLLNDLWHGDVKPDNPLWKILLRVLIPCIPFAKIRGPFDKENEMLESQWGTFLDWFNFIRAPKIKFIYNLISYIVFLVLFTHVLVFDFKENVSAIEIYLMVWVFTACFEEARQLATRRALSFKRKLATYITDIWNIIDISSILLFIVGVIVRFVPGPDNLEAARVVLSVAFIAFCLRLLHVYCVQEELAKKLVMIGAMIQDLLLFVFILLIFIVSYSIAAHAILYPNSPVDWDTIKTMIRRGYWNIFGELYFDEIEGKEECSSNQSEWLNPDVQRCPSEVGKEAVPVVMGIYVLFTNILLLNILIAMFSYTFGLIQANQNKHWCMLRYQLIYDYYRQPVLCPPLIFISHLYYIYLSLRRCCSRKKEVKKTANKEQDDGSDENVDSFCMRFFSQTTKRIIKLESSSAEEVYSRMFQKESQDIRQLVEATQNDVRTISDRVQTAQDEIKFVGRRLDSMEKMLQEILQEVKD